MLVSIAPSCQPLEGSARCDGDGDGDGDGHNESCNLGFNAGESHRKRTQHHRKRLCADPPEKHTLILSLEQFVRGQGRVAP